MQRGEYFFGEAGADIAYGLIGVIGGVVAGEQEGAKDRGAFAAAVVGAQDDEVEGIAEAGEVVFLDLFTEVSVLRRRERGERDGDEGRDGTNLEPVPTPLTGFVATLVAVEHLYHKTFTGRFDTLIQEVLNFVEFLAVHVCSEAELSLDGGERLG